MAQIFEEDFLDKLVAIHFPQGDIAALHYDFSFEALLQNTWNMGLVPTPAIAGVGADLLSPLTIATPPKLLPSPKMAWAYKPFSETIVTPAGGTVTIVERGLYQPRIVYIKNGKQQSVLITADHYGSEGTTLPLLIDHTGNTNGGAFNDIGARAILADFQEFFAFNNHVQTVGSAWVLTQATISHTEGGTAINTHIDGKGIHFFDMSRIRGQFPKVKSLALNLNVQGQTASNQVDASWTLELTTWKKVKTLEVDGDFQPNWNAQQVSDVRLRHDFNETNISGFAVTFNIDMKSLQATGQSVPPP